MHDYLLIFLIPSHYQILRRGAHINDKDGLTDLSLLHYASKAGAGSVTLMMIVYSANGSVDCLLFYILPRV